MGTDKNIKLHIVTDIKAEKQNTTQHTMFRLAQRSSVLGASLRQLVSKRSNSSVAVTDAFTRAEKAVVFNLGGAVVPSMMPVIKEYSMQNTVPLDDVARKVLSEGDAATMEAIGPMLGSRHGSRKENYADLVSAIESIQGEGWKCVLVNDSRGHTSIPVDTSIFDQVIRHVDNCADTLQQAADLGLTTVNVGDLRTALVELEGHLGVPLKQFVAGLTWNWYEADNNPYKTGSGWYYFILLCVFVKGFQIFTTKILELDNTHHTAHPDE